ncbi:hypothetical protein ASZ90_011145 [hydrocarbon metagenome]|uniref:Archaeal flagella protein FlaD/E domain-containing protein n=1 Tax=hydrocarbon metagenome TaxID=938273 RepID=A0A0W8FEC9_9ZZZZ
MGVDQAQIDKILSGASTEDPEARLESLEKEVDFIKASIKRLLIDIRERMNEIDNPFTAAAVIPPVPATPPAEPEEKTQQEKLPELPDPEPGREEQKQPAYGPYGLPPEWPGERPGMAFPYPFGEQTAVLQGRVQNAHEKLRLQKVHRLFEWTNKACSKYGHDRLEMMIDSYRAMGYITGDAADQIREIARLMPSSLGESHTIGPDEFVSELYVLNRILDPNDTTLDRDMIEVLMLKRQKAGGAPGKGAEQPEGEAGDEWMRMLDRI